MAEHPNAAVVRQIFAAYLSGDMDTAFESLDDDIVWHYIGSSEPLRGRAAVAERGAGNFGAEIEARLHDVLASDDHVVAMLKVHAERNGKTLDYDVLEVYHIRDGKCTERWAASYDTEEIAAFFA